MGLKIPYKTFSCESLRIRGPAARSKRQKFCKRLTSVSIFHFKIVLLAYLQINDLGMPKKRLIRQKQTIINSIIKI